MAGQFLCKAAIFWKCSGSFLISDQNKLRLMAFYGNFNITSKPGQVIFGIYRACVNHSLNVHRQLRRGARYRTFCLNIYLHPFYVCEQWRLLRDCVYAQTRLSIR